MSIVVTEDLIEGHSASRTSTGPAATRTFRAVTSANETLFDVLADPAIPQYGEVHPETPWYLSIYAYDIQIVPEAEQNNIFTITVNYTRPDFATKEPSEDAADSTTQVGSSVSNTKTQKDKSGNQLVISLTGQPDQTGDVDIQVPETVLMFERREATNPITKALANTGKVNSASLGSGTYAARTLLCLGIDGITTDNGESWQVTYRFQYNPATWDAVAVYIDPETDRPHADVDLSQAANSTYGWIKKEIYSTVDFSSLNLAF